MGKERGPESTEADFAPVWYTIPQFAEVQPLSMYHKEQDRERWEAGRTQEDCEQGTPGWAETAGMYGRKLQNLHVLARAEYFASAAEPCWLRISADDYYKLYVNGVFAAQGPAPGYPEQYFYNEIDLTELLEPGRNVLAVHLYYQGLVNRVWNSGDLRFGVGAQIGCPGESGYVWKDLAWRYQISEAYSGTVTGYETQFLEDFDGRRWEEDWNRPEYDDAAWQPMAEARWADYSFVEPAVPVLQVYRKEPRLLFQRPDGSWFVDLGCEVTGGLRIRARGGPDTRIRIRCAEELETDGTVRYRLRCGCTYEESWITGEGERVLEPYDYKAFRYAEIAAEGAAEVLEVCAVVRHYPFDEEACVLTCGDRRLEQVFAICKNGVRYGTQEGYLDCPSREKGQYLGDAVISAHAQVWLTGRVELLRKCIGQFAATSRICPGLMGVAPGSWMQEIADFSLMWPELLLLDYQFTGDRVFLQRYYPTARAMVEYFSGYARADGLLEQVADKWNLVDWPENLRDGYDFGLTRPVVAPGCHNVINALYIGAVKNLGRIEALLGLPATWDAGRLTESYRRAFYREEQGLFADNETSEHCALHSNAYALYYGLAPEERVGRIADFLTVKGFCCGVMVSYFVLKGLARAGRYREVWQLLVNESEHGWMNMVREGATTCWEAWGKDQKWNTSLCHPWASAPVAVLIEDLAGIVPDPDAPGGYRLEMHLPEEIGDFSLRVPFRGGSVTVERTLRDSAGGCVDC